MPKTSERTSYRNKLRKRLISIRKAQYEFSVHEAALEKELAIRLKEEFDKTKKEMRVPTDAELNCCSDEEKDLLMKQNGEIVKGVPYFWRDILGKEPLTARMIHEQDEEVLEVLKDISVQHFKIKKGYKLEFSFGENRFFSNTRLVKTFETECGMLSFGGQAILKTQSTNILWKMGMDLTRENIPDANISQPRKSFFDFFQSIDLDFSNDDATRALLYEHFDVGEMLRENLVPRCFYYFIKSIIPKEGNNERTSLRR